MPLTYHPTIASADSPAQLPALHSMPLGLALFHVDATDGPVVLVLPPNEELAALRSIQAVYGFRVRKIAGEHAIIIRPTGAQFINSAAPTEDHTLASSDTPSASVREWEVKRDHTDAGQWKAGA